MKKYVLSIEEILPASPTFPAYFVGSTAPDNVEDGLGAVESSQGEIDRITQFLKRVLYV